MGNYINDALLQTNNHKKLKEETQAIVSKWEKTGLLEGLDGDYDKSGMASLLENQAKQLIDESSQTGTGGSNEEWAGVALPLVRRIFAEIAAQDFVSVQPMNLPSGLVFYLDFKYGSTQSGRTTSESVYGKTGPFSPLSSGGNNPTEQSSPFPEGGLYGAGQYDYTQPTSSALVTSASATIGAVTDADINFDTNWSASYADAASTNEWNKLTVLKNSTGADSVADFSRADDLSIRAWQVNSPVGLIS